MPYSQGGVVYSQKKCYIAVTQGSRCSTPTAFGSAAAPFVSSVPRANRARVSARAIRVSARQARRQLRRGGRRAQLVPLLEPGPTAGRVTYGTNTRTNRLGPYDSNEQARWPREPARGPPARASLGRRAGGTLPQPATRTNGHQPARSEPDPGPCLRLWGLQHRPMRRGRRPKRTCVPRADRS